MRWLDEALREKFGWMLYIKMEPAFDSVRADPEYRQEFLRLSDRTQSLNASPAEGPVS
jgi:hypothetical protein